MAENCTYTVVVFPSGAPTCTTILTDYHLTIAQFYAMNPSVGADCSGLWAGETAPSNFGSLGFD